jgi:hypothetical protein
MSFTLTFSPPLGPTAPITVTTSNGVAMIFQTGNNGGTYTLTSTDTITVLDGFYNQTWSDKLSSVTNIPNTVTSIGTEAFAWCRFLTSINIPNSVTSIGNNAFENCRLLTSINIPNSVTSIGDYAFYLGYLTSIIIPSSVTSIGEGTFAGCFDLTSITIPNSVTSIGSYAFQECDLLASINIPNGVTVIRESTFLDCTSLTSITISSSVTVIENDAFAGCTSLTSITIPNSVTSIGRDAFSGIPNQSSTIITTPIPPTPSFAYNWLQPRFSNITFQDPPLPPPIICFKEDTKILTNKGYIPIQNLRNGDLIKTINHDYVPINMIGKRDIYHSALKQRIKDQLYKCSQSEYPEIFEDLIITGCHAILVDEFKEGEREKTIEVLERIFVTDRKYRLPACVDERANVYEIPGDYTIYHIALENDDYRMNYGIYANGLLVESCSKRHLKELSKMELL